MKEDTKRTLAVTVGSLKRQVDEKKFLDVGKGAEKILGVSRNMLVTAVNALKDSGYEKHVVLIGGIDSEEKRTAVAVLAPHGTTYADVMANRSEIQKVS